MSRPAVVAALAAGVGVPAFALVTVLGGSIGASAAPTVGTTCTMVDPAGPPSAGETPPGTLQLSGQQLANAQVIVAVAKAMRLPRNVAAVAVMTAQTESGLLNLDHGDQDSLGLFQQRPSKGWGTPAQIMDPTYAATAFYTHLAAVPGWADMPMPQAAQIVQSSAYPDRYAASADFGTAVAAALWDGAQGQLMCTQPIAAELPTNAGPVAGAVLAFAEAQLGKPYSFGATGPDSFDCSGLALRAYQAAGIGLPRTSEDQWSAGPHVQPDQLAPGDLVFFDPDLDGRPGHVGIYAGNGTMIDAPHTGGFVRVEAIAGFGTYLGAVRPTDGQMSTLTAQQTSL